MQKKSTNTVWHHGAVSRADREKLNDHKSVILWFTGLSGAGKSTLANEVEALLYEKGKTKLMFSMVTMSGRGYCGDLTFSDEDRVENIRRIGEVAKLMIDAGLNHIVGFYFTIQS